MNRRLAFRARPLPEGVAIAILQWNVLMLLIDRYVAQPKFGELKTPWVSKAPVSPKPVVQTVEKTAK